MAAVVGTASVSATAGAQVFDPDRAAREGPGFKAGRLVLHPGLAIGGGYDSNVFLQSSDELSSFILLVQGYLDIATEGSIRQSEGDAGAPERQKIQFRGGIGADFLHYFTDRVGDAVGADAHIDFAYNPSEVFSLLINNVFLRTVRPFSDPNTPQGPTISYGRNLNRASLDLVGRSKSQVLEGTLGYTNSLEFFDANIYSYGNNITHRVPASFSWLFFPSSALVYTIEYANQQFANPAQIATSPTLLSRNNRVSNMIGYNGAITERFSLTAMIGYAAGFYKIGQDFDDVIARVELRWQARPTIGLSLSYDRDVRPSFIGNFVLINRLHASTTFTLMGALQLGVKAWVSFDDTGLALSPDGTLLGSEPTRDSTRVYVGIFGEYRFKPWLALFADLGYLADFTDFAYVGVDPSLLDPVANYQRFEAWLGLRVFY
ncbi:MAG: hypothetical protein HKN10_18605 [Myxococcales bacterium]|nr:hypothetical protein [Deltaproteobacteria bacterium]NNE20483.1 hypothetical protein [Myxococcales bacterium]